MRQDEIDLDRAINDPEYRRKVIKQLNAEAARRGVAPNELQRLQAGSVSERDG